MSDIPLNDMQQRMERSILKAIEQECIDKGYSPDISKFEDSPAGKQAYTLAQQEIIATKGFCISIFGQSSNRDKLTKTYPRIVFYDQGFLEGAIGGDRTRKFTPVENGYQAYYTPPQTSHYYFDIHIISNNTSQHRILHSLMAISLPKRGYIKFYDDPTSTFFINYLNYYNQDDPADKITERVYAYEIQDCWDEEDKVEPTIVSPIKEINVQIGTTTETEGDVVNLDITWVPD